MINVNISVLLVQMVILLVLYFILGKLFFKPIANLLHARKEHVESLAKKNDDKREETSKLVKDYEKSINDAKAKAVTFKEEIKKEGLQREKEILNAAHKEHADAVNTAKEKAKKEFESAQKEIAAHVKALSIEVSEKILQRKV